MPRSASGGGSASVSETKLAGDGCENSLIAIRAGAILTGRQLNPDTRVISFTRFLRAAENYHVSLFSSTVSNGGGVKGGTE